MTKKAKKKRMRLYAVVLSDGRDYTVRATGKQDAIKRVRSGKGRLSGCYLEETLRDSAEPLD